MLTAALGSAGPGGKASTFYGGGPPPSFPGASGERSEAVKASEQGNGVAVPEAGFRIDIGAQRRKLRVLETRDCRAADVWRCVRRTAATARKTLCALDEIRSS